MSREKQIEEMAKALTAYEKKLCDRLPKDQCLLTSAIHAQVSCDYCKIAEYLYNAGYRKQSEGEWKIKSEIHQMFDDVDEELYVECPFCQRTFWVPYEFEDKKIFEYAREHYPYCNCGAKMKGGAE